MTRQQAARQRRLLRRHRRICMWLLLIVAVLILTPLACTRQEAAPQTLTTPHASIAPSVTVTPAQPSEPAQTPWTEEEVLAIAKTLAGECYEDKTQDKRMVAEVIVNRVSAGGFGDAVIDVVTSPYQFVGYWNPSREISENDILIATKTLRDWYANDCAALSEWLYFTAGDNRENNFRTEY